jgi:hypothetical protein
LPRHEDEPRARPRGPASGDALFRGRPAAWGSQGLVASPVGHLDGSARLLPGELESERPRAGGQMAPIALRESDHATDHDPGESSPLIATAACRRPGRRKRKWAADRPNGRPRERNVAKAPTGCSCRSGRRSASGDAPGLVSRSTPGGGVSSGTSVSALAWPSGGRIGAADRRPHVSWATENSSKERVRCDVCTARVSRWWYR